LPPLLYLPPLLSPLLPPLLAAATSRHYLRIRVFEVVEPLPHNPAVLAERDLGEMKGLPWLQKYQVDDQTSTTYTAMAKLSISPQEQVNKAMAKLLVKDAKGLINYHNKEKSYAIAEMGDRFAHYLVPTTPKPGWSSSTRGSTAMA
jgi:hypothetical protein